MITSPRASFSTTAPRSSATPLPSAKSAPPICWRESGSTKSDGTRSSESFHQGMLQRVGLAQSLINDPEIVFLDEPMSGLDPVGRREVRDLIASLRKTVRQSSCVLTFFPTSKCFAIGWRS